MQAENHRPSPAAVLLAALLCTLVALAWLWPLPLRPGSALVPDLGDPLLNTWILAWNFHQGASGAGSYWDANIFHPLDGTLAFSETLAPLAVLGFPVWLITGNAVLAYNVLLLLSFAVGGGAVFALTRRYLEETIGAPSSRARTTALVAAAGLGALLFAFSPYRQQHLPHIQVLWASWLPLTVLAAERYLDRPSAGWLTVTVGSATALALTNTYFAVFGGLVLVVFIALRGGRRLLRSVRGGSIPRRHLGVAVVLLLLSAVVLLSFGAAYAGAQGAHGIERPVDEVRSRSARPGHLLQASTRLTLWGERLGDVRQDVELRLFPGMLTAALALLGAAASVGRAVLGVAAPEPPAWRRWAARLTGLVTLLSGAALAYLLAGNVIDTRVLGIPVTMTTRGRPAVVLAVALVGWLVLSPHLRARLRRLGGLLEGPWGWLLVATPVVWLVAMGPAPGADDWWLTRLLPVTAGLRVPARAFALVALGLALLAARGAWELLRRLSGAGAAVLAALLAVVAVGESWAAPVPLNRPIWIYPALDTDGVLAAEPSDLARRLAALPDGTPLAVLPLGEDQIDLIHMYRSTDHWQPLANGFSGFIPPGYRELERRLRRFPEPDALQALDEIGVRWVVVHPDLWPEHDRDRLRHALASSGALAVIGYWPEGLLVRILDPDAAP